MSTDAYFIRFNKSVLKSKIVDFKNPDTEPSSFEKYVLYNNESEKRDFLAVYPAEIILKIENNCDTLEIDEIDEIMSWIHYITFKTPPGHPLWSWFDEIVLPELKCFGFELIYSFRDNDYTFLHPYGDFMYEYYNDFEGIERDCGNLHADEFLKVLDYIICYNSMILLKENEEHYYITDYDTLEEAVTSIHDEKIKAIAEKNSEIFINNGVTTESGYKDYSGGGSREVTTGHVSQNLFYAEELKKLTINNQDNIIILIA